MSSSDPTPSQLATLDPSFRPYPLYILTVLRELGVPAIIVALGARRTLAQQEQLVAAGRSELLNSAHLAGWAFDLDLWGWNRDDVPQWFWQAIGPWAESFGMRWGGRWGDYGHFEIVPPGGSPRVV